MLFALGLIIGGVIGMLVAAFVCRELHGDQE